MRDLWPWLAFAIILLGLASQNAAVVVLGFAVALVFAGALLWSRWSLRRLTYERLLPEDRAFAGESVDVTLRIANRKPLPLASVEVRDEYPEDMTGTGDEEFAFGGHVGKVGLEWRTSVGGWERVARRIRLACPERGVYALGPATLRSGDPIGMFPSQATDERLSRVVVYPRTVPLGDLALPSRRPFGDRPQGLRIFEDPSRIAGLRDYQPGDSLRRVDWKATARLGKLQSRVYDPTSSHQLLVCLNTQTVFPAWAGFIPDLLEQSIVVAASVARDAYDERYAVGLLANSSMPEADQSMRIPPGRRPEQLIRVLEALAVVTPFVLEPLAALIDREEHRLAAGTTLAVIAPTMPEELAATLLRLRRRGHAVAVLSPTGESWPELLGDVPVMDVSHVASLWQQPVEEAEPEAVEA